MVWMVSKDGVCNLSYAEIIINPVSGLAKDFVKNGIKDFTGEKINEETEIKLKNLEEEKVILEDTHNNFCGVIKNSINESLSKISEIRMSLQNIEFKKFLYLSAKFNEWKISEIETFKEFYIHVERDVNVNTNRKDLFKIDFENDPVTSYFKAFSSCGFWSRYQANESKNNVENQYKVLQNEIANLEGDKLRIKKVKESLEEIATYFETFFSFYKDLLSELDYSIDMLSSSYLMNNSNYFDAKIDIYFLPKKFQLQLMAADILTRILYNLASRKYLDESLTIISSDKEKIEEEHSCVNKIKSWIAA